MTADGLWTVKFASTEESRGGLELSEELQRGGLFVITGGNLYGGGISYYFHGTCDTEGKQVNMDVEAVRYNDLVPGQFGDRDRLQILFSGTVDGDDMTLAGECPDVYGVKLRIEARRRKPIAR